MDSRLKQKTINKEQRAHRTRSKLHGTAQRPRLSVHISNTHITAQLIDDDKGVTLVYATTVGNKLAKGTMLEKSTLVGSTLAKKSAKAGIKTVIFDRGARPYHGRVKALAESAREGGLGF